MAEFNLTSYKALSFDIYATLIDWETGIFKELAPLLGRLPKAHPLWEKSLEDIRAHLLLRYAANEHDVEKSHPFEKYSTLLSMVYERLATELNVPITKDEALSFGGAIGKWPAFPDTVAAMQSLGKRYKLVALSNVDRESFGATLKGPLNGVKFDAIYTAEDIGSYKPDKKNFEYLVSHVQEDFGISKSEICHTAQSLTFDHVPAAELKFNPGVWISRGGGSMDMGDLEAVKTRINLGATYETLGDMAKAVEKAFDG
ncbi:HAD-like domain-containing protein [Xylogone sp. PMI_703]|nr:HAD-like domain-containing protein [Xylogone sp. PMI_703]